MRIAYLLPDPGIPVGGTKGASVHVAEICRALAACGASVLLLAQRVQGPAPPGVRLVHLDPGQLPRGRAGELPRAAAAEGFVRRAEPILEAFRPDAVIERLSLFAAGTGTLAARLGVPRLVEVNAPVATERARHFGLDHHDLATAFERRALDRAHALVVSDALAGWARLRGAAEVTVIGNGVDAARFRMRPAERAAVRAKLGVSDAEVVGFCGSLKPWHGLDVLAEAFERLVPENSSLVLVIVGDGPGGSWLKQQARSAPLAGRMVLTGAVAPSDVPAYLSAFDIAVAPFLPSEDFYFSPLKVAEAMAAGLPVIASRLAPIEAMLGGTGELFAPGNSAELARAIGALADDQDRARDLGRAARDRAESELSWDWAAHRILAIVRLMRTPSATLRRAG